MVSVRNWATHAGDHEKEGSQVGEEADLMTETTVFCIRHNPAQ